jgi:tetratricopeptide (TPR) repeat protein
LRTFAPCALAALSAAVPAAAPAQTAAPAPHIFEERGATGGGADDGEGGVLLTLWSPHIRFHVPRQPEGALEPLGAIVRRSNETGQSMILLYDGTRAHLDHAAGTLDFPLCRVVLGELVFQPAIPCLNAPADASQSPETALGLGYAYSARGDSRHALELLGQVRSDDASLRKLLLRIRGDASSGLFEESWSDAADRANLAALTDYRALAALQPADVEIQFRIASALQELGDYPASRAVLDTILVRWPDEEFRAAVRIGALYRLQGENEKALEQLDNFVARHGPQPGMRFHYHRGWTLTRLGRFSEAVAEFTEGLKRQPDYAYAYIRRSCAEASIGRLEEALADLEQGRTLLAGLPSGSADILFDIRRAEAVRAALKRELAAGGNRPLLGTCGGYWGHADEARQRSLLLPPA